MGDEQANKAAQGLFAKVGLESLNCKGRVLLSNGMS